MTDKEIDDGSVFMFAMMAGHFIESYAEGALENSTLLLPSPDNDKFLYGLKRKHSIIMATAFANVIRLATLFAENTPKRQCLESFITNISLHNDYPKTFTGINEFIQEDAVRIIAKEHLRLMPAGVAKELEEIEEKYPNALVSSTMVGLYCRCFYAMCRAMNSLLSFQGDNRIGNIYRPDWLPSARVMGRIRAGTFWSFALMLLHSSSNAYGSFVSDLVEFINGTDESESNQKGLNSND